MIHEHVKRQRSRELVEVCEQPIELVDVVAKLSDHA
jgi:hypothetical protein